MLVFDRSQSPFVCRQSNTFQYHRNLPTASLITSLNWISSMCQRLPITTSTSWLKLPCWKQKAEHDVVDKAITALGRDTCAAELEITNCDALREPRCLMEVIVTGWTLYLDTGNPGNGGITAMQVSPRSLWNVWSAGTHNCRQSVQLVFLSTQRELRLLNIKLRSISHKAHVVLYMFWYWLVFTDTCLH